MYFFRLFRQYPPLGIAVCAALFYFVSCGKMIEEGRLQGYFGGAKTFQAAILERSQTTGRRGIPNCKVKARAAEKVYSVAADCSDWNSFTPGATIELVTMSDGVQSLEFMKGHFYIDLFLVLLEIVGAIYFAWLTLTRFNGEEPSEA